MSISLLPLPSFPSKNLGEYAECALPVRGLDSFSDLFLRVAGQGFGVAGTPLNLVHAVETIELQQDGETVMAVSPHALRLIEALTNTTADTFDPSVLAIPLARLGLSQVSDWPTGLMDKFLLRVKLRSAFQSNGANPAMTLTELTAAARVDKLPAPAPRGSVFTFHTASHLPVVGANTIENLSLRNLRRLTKLILFCPPAAGALSNAAGLAITSAKVTRGREVVFDATKQIAVAELKSNRLYRGMNPDSGATETMPIVFDITGRPGEYLDLIAGNVRQTIKIEFTWAAGTTPETIHILAEGIIDDNGAPVVAAV